MERANVLSKLRGEGSSIGWIMGSASPHTLKTSSPPTNSEESLATISDNLKTLTEHHFEPSFLLDVPDPLLKLILWCTQTNPLLRPSATELLNSEFIPHQMAVEKK
jgi:hypothetical protein